MPHQVTRSSVSTIVCTTAKTDEEARALLEAFNFPFRKSTRPKAAA